MPQIQVTKNSGDQISLNTKDQALQKAEPTREDILDKLLDKDTNKEDPAVRENRIRAKIEIDEFMDGSRLDEISKMIEVTDPLSKHTLINEVLTRMNEVGTSTPEGAITWTIGMRIITKIDPTAATPLLKQSEEVEKLILSSNFNSPPKPRATKHDIEIDTTKIKEVLSWAEEKRLIPKMEDLTTTILNKAEELGKYISTLEPKSLPDSIIKDLDESIRQTRLVSILYPEHGAEFQRKDLVRIQNLVHNVESNETSKYVNDVLRIAENRLNESPIRKEEYVLSRFALNGNEELREYARKQNDKYSPELNIIAKYLTQTENSLTYVQKSSLRSASSSPRGFYQNSSTSLQESGETWKISIPAGGFSDILINLKNEVTNASLTLTSNELANLITENKIDSKLDKISSDYDKEQNASERKGLTDLDLKKGGTALITVISKTHDPLTSGSILPAFLLEGALIKRYGEIADPRLIVSDSPLQELRQSIEDLTKNNKEIKDLVIQLHDHGSNTEIKFKDPIHAKELAELAKEFPDVKLHIITIACFGGGVRTGLEQEFAKNPDLKNNINFYGQTKPDTVNLCLMVKDVSGALRTDISTSAYMLHLIGQLLDENINTFGEAINEADKKAKVDVQLDAEALINGDFYSLVMPPKGDFYSLVMPSKNEYLNRL